MLGLEKALTTDSSGNSHERRSLVGFSPWGCEEVEATERLPFHFSLSCIGEGNGSPLQCSCPENPRDGGAWWAAVYGVAQSRTRLTWLSSSSSAGSLLLHSLFSSFCVQASHCGGFSCCGARDLGPLGFGSCGSWALEHGLNSCGAPT